jgi:hypothetical protein
VSQATKLTRLSTPIRAHARVDVGLQPAHPLAPYGHTCQRIFGIQSIVILPPCLQCVWQWLARQPYAKRDEDGAGMTAGIDATSVCEIHRRAVDQIGVRLSLDHSHTATESHGGVGARGRLSGSSGCGAA